VLETKPGIYHPTAGTNDMPRGLTQEQTHRILENFQRKSIILKALDIKAKEHKDEVLHLLVQLAKEENDALYADIKGMRDGNNKGGENG
jgi:hypothetical protein